MGAGVALGMGRLRDFGSVVVVCRLIAFWGTLLAEEEAGQEVQR